MAPPDATTTTRSPEATTAALDESAVVRWWQVTGFMEVAGPDACSLLDGLCTQAVERIEPGTGTLGLFLDAKARIIAPAVIHRRPDAPWHDERRDETVEHAPRLLLEALPDLVEPLRSHLVKYRLRARASIEARPVATVALVGAHAGDVDVPHAGAWSTLLHEPRPTRAWLGIDADAGDAASVVRQLAEAGVGLAHPDALEADRIAAGSAGLHDLLPGRMPAEVGGMDRAVALDAGCYLGQEPVARLHYRGRANRSLRTVVADGPVEPGSGEDDEATLALRRAGDPDDARPVGRLTTWAAAPDGRTVGLAMLRRELEPGDELRVGDGGSTVHVVAAAP